jgi:hypothetical protein
MNQEQSFKTNDDILSSIDQERELSKKSLKEIEGKWKSILKTEKVISLKVEAEALRGHYDKEVQEIVRITQILYDCFERSEDQYRKSVASNFQAIDDLIDIYDTRLLKLERDYRDSVTEMKSSFDNEQEVLKTKFDSDKAHILDEIAAIKAEDKKLRDKSTLEQQQSIEEIRNKHLEEVNNLRFLLDTRIEDLNEQFETAQNEYLQKTDSRTESLQQILTKDNSMTKELIVLQNKIDHLSKSTQRLTTIQNRYSLQNMDQQSSLLERKNDVIMKYRDTKGDIESLRLSRHARLKELTNNAHTVKASLEEENGMFKRMQKVSKLIQKMESSTEMKYCTCQKNNKNNQAIKERLIDFILEKQNVVLLSSQKIKEHEETLIKQNVSLKVSFVQLCHNTI